jgi:hypothetical protein
MASASSLRGIGEGIGSLLGWFIRGREEKEYEEKLKQMVLEQQRQTENQRLGLTGQQGPPRPEMPAPAAAPQSFGEMLMGIPSTIGAGITRESPEIKTLEERYRTGAGELERTQTMADWLQKQQLENQMPLAVSKKQEAELLAERQKQTQEAILQRQMQMSEQQNQLITAREMALRRIPQATAPSFQEQIFGQMSPSQKQQYVTRTAEGAGIGGVKPQIKQVGDMLTAIEPQSGQVVWSTPNPKKLGLREKAAEALGRGETLPGLSPEETKQMVIGNQDPFNAMVNQMTAQMMAEQAAKKVAGQPVGPLAPTLGPKASGQQQLAPLSKEDQALMDRLKAAGLEVRPR